MRVTHETLKLEIARLRQQGEIGRYNHAELGFFRPYGAFVRLRIIARRSAIVLAPLVSFGWGVYSARTLAFPYPQISRYSKIAIRQISIMRMGKAAYVENQLRNQYRPATEKASLAPSLLETAVLPIAVDPVSLNHAGNFPSGGGALTTVGDVVIVLDRLGRLYRVDGDSVRALDLPEIPSGLHEYVTKSANPTLNVDLFRAHSLAYSAKHSTLYVSFQKYVSRGVNRLTIASIPLSVGLKTLKKEWTTLFQSEDLDAIEHQANAGGGKLLVAGDSLIFSVGDFSGEAVDEASGAQNPSSTFGKIYTLNLTSRVVTMLSRGHRNTQGLAFTSDGNLLNVEQGPQGGDEVNHIVAGHNYGWPIQTYGTSYGKYTWPMRMASEGKDFDEPIFAFVPSVASASILQVHGFHPEWDGDLLVGSLKGQTLFRLKYKQQRIVFSEPIWIGHRVRDMVQVGPRLYLLTDDSLLLRLTVDRTTLSRDSRSSDIPPSELLTGCLKCHHFGRTDATHFAPSLSSLFDRKRGSDSYSRYSQAMRTLEGPWTAEELRRYLADPNSLVPGSSMPKPALSAGDIDRLIAELRER